MAVRSAASYFPILQWGRTYDRQALTGDLLAAVIVTIMLIPQSLAYALLAGLPPEAGFMPRSCRSCSTRCSARRACWPWGRWPWCR
jgi:MFS superfamily sulfate permease-like transporter